MDDFWLILYVYVYVGRDMYVYAFELFHIIVCSLGFAFVYFFYTSEHVIISYNFTDFYYHRILLTLKASFFFKNNLVKLLWFLIKY
jgi:hypothetical protein